MPADGGSSLSGRRTRDLTLAEVAELRRKTTRQLREYIRRHKIPVLHDGKQITFDDFALAALEEALRRPCPSKSSDEKTPEPSPSRAPSNYRMARGSEFERALNLTNCASPAKKPPRSKRDSSGTRGTENVVALDRSGRR